MKVIETDIPDVKIIEPKVFGDERGFFMETWNQKRFEELVDIRKDSPTFGKWVGVYLSAENKRQLWVPEGFAHGFYVTSDEAEFVYKCTDYYNPTAEHSLLWNDPDIGIKWPVIGLPVLSQKDANAKQIKDQVFI
ncbi:dTDP-4-dehydrorhamnose 3,5-epimerase family protein [Vibrio cholerae]|uniref:dTDP-4-dehydrorhamnose 3,5-epimerase family protein n=1 Tax=Vibrio cholerae TaxID=666 RepID=UPI000E0E06DC|nr:dTDP-4-dehydrorhamnose 3,5-epimerase [Vibrio cholerae]